MSIEAKLLVACVVMLAFLTARAIGLEVVGWKMARQRQRFLAEYQRAMMDALDRVRRDPPP